MNIVIPLAGKDPHFTTFKPFTPFQGKLLIEPVVQQHAITGQDRLIFILLKKFEDHYSISKKLIELFGDKIIIRKLPELTKGAPCSILEAAGDLIDTNVPVLIELADVLRDLTTFNLEIRNIPADIAGIIPVEPNRLVAGRPWGYVTLNNNRTIEQLTEKQYATQPGYATMGLYFFSKGSEFIQAAKKMIKHNSFVYNNNYFVGPVYNELVKEGKNIITSHVRINHILGSPEDFTNT